MDLRTVAHTCCIYLQYFKSISSILEVEKGNKSVQDLSYVAILLVFRILIGSGFKSGFRLFPGSGPGLGIRILVQAGNNDLLIFFGWPEASSVALRSFMEA
jgi:hypothetical protein